MKFYVRVKPAIFKAKTKDELLAQIRLNYGLIWMSAGWGHGWVQQQARSNDIRRFGINMQKYNRKALLMQEKTDSTPVERVVMRETHWIAWVYEIPEFMMLKQLTRTFEVKVK